MREILACEGDFSFYIEVTREILAFTLTTHKPSTLIYYSAENPPTTEISKQ